MMRHTVKTLLVAAIVIGAYIGSRAQAMEAAGVVDFTLPQLHGEAVSLSDYRGQWVVVNYWATWCAPCRKEIPDLSALHDGRADVTVLGLAYEEVEEAAFEAFLKDFPASYPILKVDVFEPPAALGTPRVLPTTYVVNPQGAIAKTFYGPITSADILDFIAAQEHG